MTADAGYSNGAHASACARDDNVTCALADRALNNEANGKLFDRSAFRYGSHIDSYRCPADRSLLRKQLYRRKRNVTYVLSDCSDCALKP